MVGCSTVREVRRGQWSDCGCEEASCRQGRMAASVHDQRVGWVGKRARIGVNERAGVRLQPENPL